MKKYHKLSNDISLWNPMKNIAFQFVHVLLFYQRWFSKFCRTGYVSFEPCPVCMFICTYLCPIISCKTTSLTYVARLHWTANAWKWNIYFLLDSTQWNFCTKFKIDNASGRRSTLALFLWAFFVGFIVWHDKISYHLCTHIDFGILLATMQSWNGKSPKREREYIV